MSEVAASSEETALSAKTALSATTALSAKTALSETTALGAKTALSETTALSDKTALSQDTTPTCASLMQAQSFTLDCWYVYPTQNRIQHKLDHEDSRQLEPRLMRLLCLLAASADAVVNRDDITSLLWPRVVVNENSLTRAVSDLRRELTPAGSKRTSVIQTIPKRGYRLTQAPSDINAAPPAGQTRHPANRQPALMPAAANRWLQRWTPSIAASFMLALALVIRLTGDNQGAPAVAQLPTPADAGANQQMHYDQVITAPTLTAEMTRDTLMNTETAINDGESRFQITRLGDAQNAEAPSWHMSSARQAEQTRPATLGQSLLTPDGQLLAYVDNQDGIASLNLQPAMSEAEPWVAFTTDERIFQLQWSPLDAGILLTVGQSTDNAADRASYLRLMLLDLETLTVQELYRRELPPEAWTQDIGNLT